MQDLAIVSPNRYLIKVEDFFTTITFLQNVTNLSEYPLPVAVPTGFEPVSLTVTGWNCNHSTTGPNFLRRTLSVTEADYVAFARGLIWHNIFERSGVAATSPFDLSNPNSWQNVA
jgi:hypothetical protein